MKKASSVDITIHMAVCICHIHANIYAYIYINSEHLYSDTQPDGSVSASIYSQDIVPGNCYHDGQVPV